MSKSKTLPFANDKKYPKEIKFYLKTINRFLDNVNCRIIECGNAVYLSSSLCYIGLKSDFFTDQDKNEIARKSNQLYKPNNDVVNVFTDVLNKSKFKPINKEFDLDQYYGLSNTETLISILSTDGMLPLMKYCDDVLSRQSFELLNLLDIKRFEIVINKEDKNMLIKTALYDKEIVFAFSLYYIK